MPPDPRDPRLVSKVANFAIDLPEAAVAIIAGSSAPTTNGP